MNNQANTHTNKDLAHHQAIAREYDEVVVAPRQIVNDFIFQWKISPLIPRGRIMLDLGCGTGHMTLRFLSRFSEVYAVDHSSAMLQEATTKIARLSAPNVRIRERPVLTFLEEWSNEPVDFICCTGFLHHLTESMITQLIGLLHSRLKPGGLCLLQEPTNTINTVPPLLLHWNATSIAPHLCYKTKHADPDEKPLDVSFLTGALSNAKLNIIKQVHNWEIFPKQIPPTTWDRVALICLSILFSGQGNVCSIIAKNSPP